MQFEKIDDFIGAPGYHIERVSTWPFRVVFNARPEMH